MWSQTLEGWHLCCDRCGKVSDPSTVGHLEFPKHQNNPKLPITVVLDLCSKCIDDFLAPSLLLDANTVKANPAVDQLII
jgi:hypothetical protein